MLRFKLVRPITCLTWLCLTTLTALAHPTNGIECTTIAEPAVCFASDGFCEWVFGQCLYRCDIHDAWDDCGQIKEGCVWNGSECVPLPFERIDANLPNEHDGTDATLVADVAALQPSDAAAWTPDAAVEATTYTTSTPDLSLTAVESSSPTCQTTNMRLTAPLWLLCYFLRRRPRTCF